MKTVLLIGNYGVQNLGDEALRAFFIERFTDVRWIIVSAQPKAPNEVARLPFGIRSFFRFQWIRTVRAYANADVVVFGGGSLFTDTESVAACFLWGVHALLAKVFRIPYHLAYQGIGPIQSNLALRCIRFVLQGAATISVRDPLSYQRAVSFCKNKKIVQSFDPVYWLIKQKNLHHYSRASTVLLLIPRNNSSDQFQEEVQRALEQNCYNEIKIVSMQIGDLHEMQICTMLQGSLQNAKICTVSSIDALMEHVFDAKTVITERYHGALVASALQISDIRVIPQRKGDKLDALRLVEGDRNLLVEEGYRLLFRALTEK